MYVPVFFVSIVVSVAVVQTPPFISNSVGIRTLICYIKTPSAYVRWEFIQSDSNIEQTLCSGKACRSDNIVPGSPYQFQFYQDNYFLSINKVGIEHDGTYYMVESDGKGVFREVEGCKYIVVVHGSKADDKNSLTECERAAAKAEEDWKRYTNTTVVLDSMKQDLTSIKRQLDFSNKSYFKQLPDEILMSLCLIGLIVIIIVLICGCIFIVKVIWSNRKKIVSLCSSLVSKNKEDAPTSFPVTVSLDSENMESNAGTGEFNKVSADNTIVVPMDKPLPSNFVEPISVDTFLQ